MTVLDELKTATVRSTSAKAPIRRSANAGAAARVLIGAAVVFVLVAIVVALGSAKGGAALDPRSYTPSGSHAISVLLGQRGVRVVPMTSVGANEQFETSGTTLVVVSPQYSEQRRAQHDRLDARRSRRRRRRPRRDPRRSGCRLRPNPTTAASCGSPRVHCRPRRSRVRPSCKATATPCRAAGRAVIPTATATRW